MSQIILIEDNQAMNDLLTINIATHIGVSVIPRNGAKDTIELLAILPNIDLIICKDKIKDEETGRLIYDHIKNNKLGTSLIVMGDFPIEIDEIVVTMKGPKNWEKTVRACARVLGISDEDLAKKLNPDYVSVPVRFFLNLTSSSCDVFIRIKKGPMDYQFIKRIHSGDSFDRESVEKYIGQGLQEFFIPQEHYKNFTTFLSNQLVTKLDDDKQTLDEKIDTIGESFSVAMQEIAKLGFTPATIQLTESIVENIVKTFQKSHLSLLMLKVLNSKHSYIYQHSHLLSVVAGECLKNLQYFSEDNMKRLAYAAFFHDITLAENEELARIRTYEELEKSELSETDWDLVFNHALEAASLVKSNPEVLSGVETIIKSHHGALNGKGYAINSYAKLDTLSQVFIICEEFVGFLIDYKEKKTEMMPLIDELKKKYPGAEMGDVIAALEKMLKNQKSNDKTRT